MAEKSEDIPGVQGIKIRKLSSDQRLLLRRTLYDSTVSDMRTLVIWAIDDPFRFDHFIDLVLEGKPYKVAMRETEYL